MNLYITIEISSRELEAKTFLACCAAAAGFDVVIGLEDMVRRYAVLGKPGVFFDKSIHSEYPPLFAFLKKLGHRIAVNDEEGLVFNPKQYSAFNLNDSVSSTVDMFFAWGDTQRDLLAKLLPEMASSAFSTSNPRMDLLHPKLRAFHETGVNAIREKYGRFCLVNTRYAFANNAIGGPAYRARLEAGKNGPNIEYLLRRYEYDVKLFNHFFEMQKQLCIRYPERNFVLRPHPSESMTPWLELAKQHKNLHVVRSGNVHQWLLASDMVIHNGCATAIEAFYLDVPCVCYRPITSEEIDIKLPNSVSYNVFDFEELCLCVEGEKGGAMQTMRPQWESVLKPFIHTDADNLAASLMIRHLLELAKQPTERKELFTLAAKCDGWIRHLNRVLKRRVKTVLGKQKVDQGNRKWVTLSVEEFQNLLQKFSFFNSDFEKLEVTSPYQDCFRVRKRK